MADTTFTTYERERAMCRRRTCVNEDVVNGKWRQLNGEIKSQWGKLTDDDRDRAEGDTEKLSRVQERYGYQREDAEREVDRFHRDLP